MTVDAVVLNWRDTARTLRCLDSLLADELIRTVYLVDNESTGDLRRALASQYPSHYPSRVQLVELAENRGFSAGVNVGIRQVLQGDAGALLCVNNDAVLQPGALASLVSALDENRAVGMVGPTVVSPSGTKLSTGTRFRALAMHAADNADGPPDALTWACVLLSTRVLHEVGLLDERFFMYWEDVEFSVRMTRLGFEIAHVPSAVVVHEVSSSHGRAGSPRIARYSAHGLVVLARTVGFRAWPATLARLTARLVRAAVRLDGLEVRGIVAGSLSGCTIRREPAWQVLMGPPE